MGVTISLSLSQGTPNTTARTTTVSATVTIRYDQGSYDGTQPSGEVTIDGKSFPFVKNFNYSGVGQGAVSQSGSTSITITHTVEYGSSSSRTVYVDASFSRASNSASGSITLTPISSGGSSGGGGGDGDNTEEWNPDNPGSGSGSGSEPDSGHGTGPGYVAGWVPADGKPGNCKLIGEAWLPNWPDGYNLGDIIIIEDHPSQVANNPKYAVIEFKTPDFDGISSMLTVDLYYFSFGSYNSSSKCSLSYALCTSDENVGDYYHAPSYVYDPNQIEYGLLSREDLKNLPFVIQTDKLKKNTSYYLVLWQPTDENCLESIRIASHRCLGHGFTVYYNSGIETINTRGVFNITGEKYECYVENGSKWDRLVAAPLRTEGTLVIDSNGSATVDCGFKPDVVVFSGLQLTDEDVIYETQLSAVFPEKETSNPVLISAFIDGYYYIETEMTQTDTGFKLSECGGMPEGGSYGLLTDFTFNYTAIKYT